MTAVGPYPGEGSGLRGAGGRARGRGRTMGARGGGGRKMAAAGGTAERLAAAAPARLPGSVWLLAAAVAALTAGECLNAGWSLPLAPQGCARSLGGSRGWWGEMPEPRRGPGCSAWLGLLGASRAGPRPARGAAAGPPGVRQAEAGRPFPGPYLAPAAAGLAQAGP